MTPYERREAMTRLLVEKPMTTVMLAKELNISTNTVRSDIDMLRKRGLLVKDGRIANLRAYRCPRIALAGEFARRTASGAVSDEKRFVVDNIPESLRIMFGYTSIEPHGARKIDNSEFMPTPVRVAPVKVYPGTSWGDVALRMPFA
jgi:DNA-binding Lrp family transcriptional regulator